jgi:outer membrane receptor protein involved in Fe transport
LLAPVPGFTVLNVLGRYRVTKRFALVGNAQNLLNTTFYTFGVLGNAGLIGTSDPRFYTPGASRGMWGGIDVQF